MEAELPLAGGTMNSVVRVGDAVLREAGPWTPQVHWLLRLLRARGVGCVPEPLGLRDDGRELLSYLHGEAGASPLAAPHRSDAVVVQAARLLRALHDATADLAGELPEGWRQPARAPVEVICHGDFAPYNCVFADGALVGVFDFDFAHPGPRAWDVAYALYRFAPLSDPERAEGFGSPAEQVRRARLFCDAYGLADRSQVIANVVERIQSMADALLEGRSRGDARLIANIEAGHLALYQHDVANMLRQRELLAAALA